jgi:hypothetical protein
MIAGNLVYALRELYLRVGNEEYAINSINNFLGLCGCILEEGSFQEIKDWKIREAASKILDKSLEKQLFQILNRQEYRFGS